jgi:hypothetical protein
MHLVVESPRAFARFEQQARNTELNAITLDAFHEPIAHTFAAKCIGDDQVSEAAQDRGRCCHHDADGIPQALTPEEALGAVARRVEIMLQLSSWDSAM